jgi:hypothetical protein
LAQAGLARNSNIYYEYARPFWGGALIGTSDLILILQIVAEAHSATWFEPEQVAAAEVLALALSREYQNASTRRRRMSG